MKATRQSKILIKESSKNLIVEDSYARVWQLNNKGALVEHWFSTSINDCLLTGAKFLDPRGSSFCVSSYDSSTVQVTSHFVISTVNSCLLKGFRDVKLALSGVNVKQYFIFIYVIK